jgi:hypothetical protein
VDGGGRDGSHWISQRRMDRTGLVEPSRHRNGRTASWERLLIAWLFIYLYGFAALVYSGGVWFASHFPWPCSLWRAATTFVLIVPCEGARIHIPDRTKESSHTNPHTNILMYKGNMLQAIRYGWGWQ